MFVPHWATSWASRGRVTGRRCCFSAKGFSLIRNICLNANMIKALYWRHFRGSVLRRKAIYIFTANYEPTTGDENVLVPFLCWNFLLQLLFLLKSIVSVEWRRTQRIYVPRILNWMWFWWTEMKRRRTALTKTPTHMLSKSAAFGCVYIIFVNQVDQLVLIFFLL